MKKHLLSKTLLIFVFLITIISTLISPFSSYNVKASSTEITQTYIEIKSLIREDNLIKFSIGNDILVKDITYERVYIENGEKISDLIVEENLKKGFGTNDYEFIVEDNTLGIKIWKVKHQEQVNYYKNKFTKGQNTIGELGSVNKKNYITVKADKLESYSFSCKQVDMEWYMWSPAGIVATVGDYLFNKENCASYTWYFSLDKEIDRIENLKVEYATFTYKEALWGWLESKYNYQSHQISVNAEDVVYDYKKFSQYAKEECHNISICNNKLFDKGKDYFQHSAFGVSDEEGYDWYLQVSLNDLLKENNLLWGAYERQDYLQEVCLVEISYWFQGEYFDGVSVLDEDTGDLIVKPDESPIDKIVQLLDKAKNWISSNTDVLFIIACAIVFVMCLPLIIKFLTIIENSFKTTSKKLEEISNSGNGGAS